MHSLTYRKGATARLLLDLDFHLPEPLFSFSHVSPPNRENRDLSHEGQMISTAGKEGGTRERGRQGPKERRRGGIIHEPAHYTGRRAGGRRTAGDATGVFSEHVSNGGPRIIWSAPGCPVASERCSAVPPPTADGSLEPLRPSGRGQTVIATERGRLPPFPLFSRMGNVSGRLLQNIV